MPSIMTLWQILTAGLAIIIIHHSVKKNNRKNIFLDLQGDLFWEMFFVHFLLNSYSRCRIHHAWYTLPILDVGGWGGGAQIIGKDKDFLIKSEQKYVL